MKTLRDLRPYLRQVSHILYSQAVGIYACWWLLCSLWLVTAFIYAHKSCIIRHLLTRLFKGRSFCLFVPELHMAVRRHPCPGSVLPLPRNIFISYVYLYPLPIRLPVLVRVRVNVYRVKIPWVKGNTRVKLKCHCGDVNNLQKKQEMPHLFIVQMA